MRKEMDVTQQSVYQYIQNIFNKICRIKEFECRKNEGKKQDIIDFWSYTFKECLILMKQIKQMAVFDRDNKVLFGDKKYTRLINNVSYYDIALLFAERNSKGLLFKEKREYINYALYVAYHPFKMFGKEIAEKKDVLGERYEFNERNKIFLIAEKMLDLEFILLSQRNLHERIKAVEKIFCRTDS